MLWKMLINPKGVPYWMSGDLRFTILYKPKSLFKYYLFDEGNLVEQYRPFGMAKAAARRRVREESVTKLVAEAMAAGVAPSGGL